jgi:hypothetical protein
MTHRLDGARLKVIRAQEHLDSLRAEIGMYLHSGVDEVVSHGQDEAGEYNSTLRVKVPPPLRLSTIVGDCVTNARAALDYVVWELASRYFHPAFDKTNPDDRRIVSYPIFRDPNANGYKDRLNRLANRRVPTDAIDRIKSTQPYNAGYEPLWSLHELVNTDKHRAPLLTIGHLGRVGIDFAEPASVNLQHGGSVIIGAAITRFTTPDLGATGVTIRSDKMHVNAQAQVFVTLQDVPVPREPVERTIEQIIKTVADVVPRFDAFL